MRKQAMKSDIFDRLRGSYTYGPQPNNAAVAANDPTAGDAFCDSFEMDEETPIHDRIDHIETGGPGPVTEICRWERLPNSFSATNHAGETRVFASAAEAEAFAATGKEG